MNNKKVGVSISILFVLLVIIIGGSGLLTTKEEKKASAKVAITGNEPGKSQNIKVYPSSNKSDKELLKRLSKITLEDLKDAKEIQEKDWDKSIILLTKLPKDNIYLYGYNDKDYQNEGIILQIGKKLYAYDLVYLTPRLITPRMYYYDYDKDGTRELGVSIYFGSGTGVALERLYIFDFKKDNLECYYFNETDYRKQIDARLSYKYNKKDNTITFYDKGEKLQKVKLSTLREEKKDFKGIGYGAIVHFNVGKKLSMDLEVGIEVPDWVTLLYDDIKEFHISIGYRNHSFKITNIQ